MDARRIWAAVLAAMLVASGVAFGAHARSNNFIVSTPSPQFAQQVAQLAEKYRHDLAIEWLGHELPPWSQPCPVTVHVGHHLGAGGATSFSFSNGQPFDWRMNIQGPPDRLLDSVLPHEVLHTVFATHFGRPLPRWADEGACTSIEHPSEKAKYHQSLIQALTTGRGIPFNRMFAMREYPADVLPLYAQGHSLARFLITLGGKRRYVAFVGDGMRWNNWVAATKKHYGFENISDLQVTWNQWVAQGCPAVTPRTSPSLEPVPDAAQQELLAGGSGTQPAAPETVALAQVDGAAAGDGWYNRKRMRALAPRHAQPTNRAVGPRSPAATGRQPVHDIASLPRDNMLSRPQQPQPAQQIILDAGQMGARGFGAPSPVYPQTMPAGPVPMTTPASPMPMTMPASAMPMTAPASPMPMTVPASSPARIIGSTPLPGTVYPISNTLPTTMSPGFIAGACIGST
jgi:hypothetical protein